MLPLAAAGAVQQHGLFGTPHNFIGHTSHAETSESAPPMGRNRHQIDVVVVYGIENGGRHQFSDAHVDAHGHARLPQWLRDVLQLVLGRALSLLSVFGIHIDRRGERA